MNSEKQNPLAGVPLEVWAGFGIGISVLAPKFPSVVSIPATHTQNSSHSIISSHSTWDIALHSWGRTHTVKFTRSARSSRSKKSYKIVILRVFFFFSVCFVFFAKIAWNHVFLNMGKIEFSRETSVVSHTVAFQAILAAQKENKLSRVNCDNFLVYDGKTGVGSMGKVEGGHAYCFIFAFQKISALQGWHRTVLVELFCTEENRIVDDLCSQILLCRAAKMSRKMGMALLVKGQPSVPEHKLKAYELGFEILKSVDDKFP